MHSEVTQSTVDFHIYGVNNGGGSTSGFSSDRFRALLGIKSDDVRESGLH